MPVVKNTPTGNNYLEKINTDGDICSRTAIRSYAKKLGSNGSSGRTVFVLPFAYEPGSHTLWVFVNGLKSVVEQYPTTNRQYKEVSGNVIQFGVGLATTDILEFIVAGSYIGDEPVLENDIVWQYTDIDMTASNNDHVFVDTSIASIIITTPLTPTPNTTFTISDYAGTFGVHSCMIDRNGSRIRGLEGNYTFNVNDITGTFVYTDSIRGWLLV
jgi:hypothetical protein